MKSYKKTTARQIQPVSSSAVEEYEGDPIIPPVEQKKDESPMDGIISEVKELLDSEVLRIIKERGGTPLIYEDDRLHIVKKFMLLCTLIGELNMIMATVWRYRREKEAWDILEPFLVPALEEIDSMRMEKNAISADVEFTMYEFKRRLAKCCEFYIAFDSNLEKRLSAVVQPSPFEIRVIDVLSGSPTADFKMSVIKPYPVSKYSYVSAGFNLRNLSSVYELVREVQPVSTNLNDQSKVIKYLRDLVRCDNVTYYQNILNDLGSSECELRLFTDTEEEEIEQSIKYKILSDKYEHVLGDLFRPQFYTPCSIELGKQTFTQTIFSREIMFYRASCVNVSINLPYLSLEHLPLLIQNHGLNLEDIVTTKRHELLEKLLLKEYMRAFNLPTKPEVEITVLYSKGSFPPEKITMKTSYSSKAKFYVTLPNHSSQYLLEY